MKALLKKEIRSFFSSATGYLVLGVFLLINGLFLWVFPSGYNLLDDGYATMDGFFSIAPYVFLFLLPAITMRMLADEQKTGTIEFLLTKPLSEHQITWAKYIAAQLLLVAALLPTLIYVFTIRQLAIPHGNVDMAGIWGSYLGLLFLGSAFAAVGLFFSSLTANQIVAFISSVTVCGFLFIGFDLLSSLVPGKSLFLQSLGMQDHYISMSRGVIDTRDVIYFLSVIFLFNACTVFKLKSRKFN